MKIILFDVDGTLVDSGEIITENMIKIIKKLSSQPNIELGIVGGGTVDKIKWQLSSSLKYFKYIFAECGALIYIDNKLVYEKNMLDFCDRKVLNTIIKAALKSIYKMPIVYHGNQIDFRKGLIYISPPGMQATSFERGYFLEQDEKFKLKAKMLKKLQSLNKKKMFEIVYGGAIGIAIYPKGWDKGQVVDFIKKCCQEDEIYFFGDKCEPGGNDYPIYSHMLVQGYAVKNYSETINKINSEFLMINN